MKKGIRVLLLTLLCAALFCTTAYADGVGGMFAISMSDGATATPQFAEGTAAETVTAEIPQGTEVLDYYEGAKRISLSYSNGIQSGAYYLVMVIKGNTMQPSADTVVYIDQVRADGDTVSFNLYPISLEIGETYHICLSTDANQEAGLVEIGSFQYGKDQKIYTISFYDDDGETVLGTLGLNRGDLPAYDGENPTKEPDNQYCYEFDKWVPEITAVAGDANYTASYRQNAHVPGEPVEENRVDSSCTQAGSYDEVVTCTLCGKELSRTNKEIPVKPHEYGEPEWIWEYDHSAAKLEFTCSVGGEKMSLDAAVTSEAGVTPGSTIYSATAEFQGTTYTDKYIDCPCDLAEPSLALSVGESAQIHVYNPYGPDDDKTVDGTLFVWESENTGIATVDAAGNVTGISAGTTQVHVTASDGSFDKSCEISVRANVSFTDVADPTQYFYNPVYWAVSQGITTGRTDTTFDPYGQCTRGHIVTFLWRAFGKPEPTTSESDNPFDDVKPSDGFYKAVLWAYENGITTGQTATTFGPWNFCTRGQIVTFLWRAFGKPEPTTSENPFDDVKSSDGFCNAVLWAVENGITTGRNPTTFDPWATCTRGQAVTFIYRAYN